MPGKVGHVVAEDVCSFAMGGRSWHTDANQAVTFSFIFVFLDQCYSVYILRSSQLAYLLYIKL